MGQDLKYAIRLLVRNPLFALTAIVSLAIGIGANTTIFTVANSLLFRPPAGVADPGRLVDVGRSQNGEGFDNNSYPNFLDLRSRNRVFEDVYAYRFGAEPLSLGGPDGAERIFGDMVTVNFFTVLGTRPYLGRLFSTFDSEQPGAAPVVVLSHRFWTRRFNADASVVGRALTLNSRTFTVIGVAPEGFVGTTILTADVWVPLTMVGELSPRRSAEILNSRESVWLIMGARLKPGVTLQQANADATSIGHALEREFPEANRGRGIRVVAQSPIPGNGAPVAAFLAGLFVVVTLVLAIACANVAGVLLARATLRRREIAVRLAIGAGRLRLIRQMLVETVLLFLLGGLFGLLLARAMTTVIVSMLPTLPVPVDVSLPLNGRILALTFALSILAAILAGLAPALHASRSEVIGGLKADGAGGPDRHRLRAAFVIGQVAFSIVLVVGSVLFVRALQRAADIDPGFEPRNLELAALDLSLAGFTEDTGRPFARDLIARVRELPGVESAALSAMMPLGNGGLGLGPLAVEGAATANASFDADWNVVTPGYFRTMKMQLVGGRDFTDDDRADTPFVIIVNETAARRWFANQNPIGRTLIQQFGSRNRPDATRRLLVIGIAHDSKYRDLGERPRPFVYVPIAQQYVPRTTIVARSTHGQRLAADLRTLLARINPNLPIVTSQTFDDYASFGLVPQRVAASVSGSLGLVGLLLAALGIYGVTAYTVASRTREIGVRVALGAQARDVVRMVLRQGMRLAAIGVAAGLALAAIAGRLLESMLFGVGAADPIAFGGSAVLFFCVGLIACYVPARRALAVDAMDALRHE